MNIHFMVAIGITVGLYSCQTTSGTSSLASAPKKPVDLPMVSVVFVANNSLAIQEHGDALCKIVEKLKDEGLAKLSHKICEDDATWIGYDAKVGLKDSNEIFIANLAAIRNVFTLATAVAGKTGGIAMQRLLSTENTLFEQDISLFVGEKIKKFEAEIEKSPNSADSAKRKEQYAKFVKWATSLNEYYQKHDTAVVN